MRFRSRRLVTMGDVYPLVPHFVTPALPTAAPGASGVRSGQPPNLYREEGLQVRTKRRKKITRPRVPMPVPTQANERWSADFMSDQLANGRRFRIFNLVARQTG